MPCISNLSLSLSFFFFSFFVTGWHQKRKNVITSCLPILQLSTIWFDCLFPLFCTHPLPLFSPELPHTPHIYVCVERCEDHYYDDYLGVYGCILPQSCFSDPFSPSDKIPSSQVTPFFHSHSLSLFYVGMLIIFFY
jgi:hypothetical protein